MSTETIRLSVNKENLVKTLKFSFNSTKSLITELAQNGRRAGATSIDFTVKEDVLICEDNGSGIDDFSKLLKVAESGWDKSIQASDSPYGLGFLIALHSGAHISVQSKGRGFEADCQDILEFKPVSIEPAEHTDGVRVTVSGVDEEFLAGIKPESIFKGFPIDVTFHGESVERVHAISEEFVSTPVGAVNNSGLNRSWIAYLQGFPVARSVLRRDFASRPLGSCTVVHLDSTKFFGNAPDRFSLVDNEKAIDLIDDAVDESLRKLLTAMVADGREGEVLQSASVIKQLGILEVLNSIDRLPEGICEVVNTQMMQQDNDCRRRVKLEGYQLCRDSLGSVALIIPESYTYSLDEYLLSEEDDSDDEARAEAQRFNALHYADKLSGVSVDTSYLHKDHWLFSLPNYRESLDVTVKLSGVPDGIVESCLDNSGSYVDVSFAGHIALSLDDGAEIEVNAAISLVGGKYKLVLNKSACLWEYSSMFGAYEDENGSHMHDCQSEDVRAVQAARHASFGGGIDELVKKALDESVELPKVIMAGKSFQVDVDADGKITVTEN